MLGQRGLSIIEVLISVGIMGIIMISIVSLQSNMARENRALTEKLAANDLARVMISALSTPATCAKIFDPANLVAGELLTFNPASVTYPFIVNFKGVPDASGANITSLGQAVSSLSNTVRVKAAGGIQVRVKTATTGEVLINFEQGLLARSLKDLIFKIDIGTTGSGAATKLTNCIASSGAPPPPSIPGSACGSGIVMFDQSGLRACCTLLGSGGEFFANATMSCSTF